MKNSVALGQKQIYQWTFKKDDCFEGLGDYY